MKIFHIDAPEFQALNLTPEDKAMLAALYSRSAESVLVHLEKVKKTGSGKFMSSFYLGYGHGSIGDCGDTTIFIEGVSILAAKAIQDTPLYNGQESSTRYINWHEQPFYNPYPDNPQAIELLQKFRDFYVMGFEKLPNILKSQYPHFSLMDEKETKAYERAINARAFDVLRGFLPAGATTNLSWTSSLRHIHDRLIILFNHPLTEVRIIALNIWQQMYKIYPDSFKPQAWYMDNGRNLPQEFFYADGINDGDNEYIEFFGKDDPKDTILKSSIDFFRNNSRSGLPPNWNYTLGAIKLQGLIDYGSHRDLQRHRKGINVMPLVRNDAIETWYIENLFDEDLKKAAYELIYAVDRFEDYQENKINMQYFIPMAMKVPYRLQWDWSQLLYVLRLRSTPMIHATLRKVVHQWADQVESVQGIDLSGIVNREVGTFDVRRGSQTILEKV